MTHPAITKEQAVQLAREAGGAVFDKDWAYGNYTAGSSLFTSEELPRLAKAIYKLGRNAGIQSAAVVCRCSELETGEEYAEVIESLKDNTP